MKRFYQWSLVLGMCLALAPVAFAKDHDRDGDHRDAKREWRGEHHDARHDWRGERRNRDWRSDREWREHRRDRYARRHRGWDGDHPRGWDKGRKEGWNSNVPPGQEGRYHGGDHHYYPVAGPGPNPPVQGQPHPTSPVVVPHNQPKPHSPSPIVFPTNKQPANNQSH